MTNDEISEERIERAHTSYEDARRRWIMGESYGNLGFYAIRAALKADAPALAATYARGKADGLREAQSLLTELFWNPYLTISAIDARIAALGKGEQT